VLNALADSTVRKRISDLGLLIVPRERQTPGPFFVGDARIL
jgi:hypothetical protein